MNKEKLIESAKKTFDECMRIIDKKTSLYGSEHIGELGLKGEFLQIHRKYCRLKTILWDKGEETGEDTNDTLMDTLMDMINSCAILISVIEENVEK